MHRSAFDNIWHLFMAKIVYTNRNEFDKVS